MVGDNAQGYVALFTLAIVRTGDLGNLVGNIHYGINIKQRIYALANDRKTLKTHAGIDIFLRKLSIVSVSVVIKLREDVVPNLYITVAVAANGAVGLAAAVFLASVIVYLRAGTAGACPMLPEIILLAEAEYLLGGYAYLVMPDAPGLIIVEVHRGIKPVRVESYPLLAL